MGQRRGRGEGSIEHLPDGRWRAILSLGVDPVTHKRRRRKLYGKTKAEAMSKLREEMARLGRGQAVDSSRITLADWCRQWLAARKLAVEPNTYEPYRASLEGYVIPRLGAVRLAALKVEDVEGLFAGMERDGLSRYKQQKAGRTLRSVLKEAARRRMVAHNVAADVPLPKAEKREMRFWTREQTLRFLAACRGDPLEPLYRLALDTGMRQGELFGLHWSEVDLAAGTVRVVRSLQQVGGIARLKDTKSRSGRRLLRLAPQTVDSLRHHLRKRKAEGGEVEAAPVFLASTGSWLDQANAGKRVATVMRRAGVPVIRFHDLRHTSATLLLAAGVNIKVVSRRLGHSDVRITLSTYAHVLPEMEEAAVEEMERLFAAVPQKAPEKVGNGRKTQ